MKSQLLLLISIIIVIKAVNTTQITNTTSSQLSFKYYIFESRCFQDFITLGTTKLQCLKYTFSKLTGYLLILLACGTRIPQIRKIVKNKSVEGLSLYSIIFETFNQYILVSYCIYKQVSINLYGQTIMSFSQNSIILILFFVYSTSEQRRNNFKYLIILIIVCIILNTDLTPQEVRKNSAIIGIVFFSLARISQLSKLIIQKSIGSLSPWTYIINIFRNSLRLLTLLIQSEDNYLKLVQSNYLLMNSLVVYFYWYYSRLGIQKQKVKKN